MKIAKYIPATAALINNEDVNDSRLVGDIKQELGESVIGYGAALGASALHNKVTGNAFRAARYFPQAKLGLLGYDAYNGYQNADKLYTKPKLKHRLASSAGEAINGLTFGLIPAKEISYGLVPRDIAANEMSREEMSGLGELPNDTRK